MKRVALATAALLAAVVVFIGLSLPPARIDLPAAADPTIAITAANVIAVGAMGWYAWRSHPALSDRLEHAPVDV